MRCHLRRGQRQVKGDGERGDEESRDQAEKREVDSLPGELHASSPVARPVALRDERVHGEERAVQEREDRPEHDPGEPDGGHLCGPECARKAGVELVGRGPRRPPA